MSDKPELTEEELKVDLIQKATVMAGYSNSPILKEGVVGEIVSILIDETCQYERKRWEDKIRELFGMSRSAFLNLLFGYACRYGSLKTAKWIYNMKDPVGTIFLL